MSQVSVIRSQFDTPFGVQFVKRRGLSDFVSVPLVRRVIGVGDQGQFSSVQDGLYALGNARMRSTPSLRSSTDVVFEIVPMFV